MAKSWLRGSFAVSGSICAALLFWPQVASAQPFPCSGGPNEQMVGTTMQGPVTVPLCVSTPKPRASAASEGEGQDDPYYVPGYIEGPRPEPPKGWRPLYAGFAEFVSMQDENGDNQQYDYVLTINHPTPQSAKEAAERECMAKAFFPDTSGACQVYLYDKPYMIVWQDWTDPGPGPYKILGVTNMEDGFGDVMVRGKEGETLLCKKQDAPDFLNPCNKLIVLLENGIWP